ncbi:hypothetical protein HK405_003356, partial [Cladochytrium tenue]
LKEELFSSERSREDTESTLQLHVEYLNKNNKTVLDDLNKALSVNVDLASHKNNAQKIRYVAKLREELQYAKEQNQKLERERNVLRRRTANLERDLESYRGARDPVPVAELLPPSSKDALFAAATPAAAPALLLRRASVAVTGADAAAYGDGAVPGTMTARRGRLSRVGRAALAARAASAAEQTVLWGGSGGGAGPVAPAAVVPGSRRQSEFAGYSGGGRGASPVRSAAAAAGTLQACAEDAGEGDEPTAVRSGSGLMWVSAAKTPKRRVGGGGDADDLGPLQPPQQQPQAGEQQLRQVPGTGARRGFFFTVGL